MLPIIVDGALPRDAELWPVIWNQSSDIILQAPQALHLSARDLSYYEYGQKIFTASACYAPLKRGQNQFFSSIIKRQGRYPSSLLDPTAGWGRDALTAALSGTQVVAMEKQALPICFLLYAKNYLYPQVAGRLRVIYQCFSKHSFDPEDFETVYLDPLFFDEKKTTSKKAMTLLYQPEQSEDDDNRALIEGLKLLEPQTLIIKKPLKSGQTVLPGVLKHSKFSRSCRYDIFYTNQQKSLDYAALFN